MTNCFFNDVYKVINFSFQFRCLQLRYFQAGNGEGQQWRPLLWTQVILISETTEHRLTELKSYLIYYQWTLIWSDWNLSINISFFARLELMVAETFGEEENSILETARLEKSWQKKKSSNTAIVLNSFNGIEYCWFHTIQKCTQVLKERVKNQFAD